MYILDNEELIVCVYVVYKMLLTGLPLSFSYQNEYQPMLKGMLDHCGSVGLCSYIIKNDDQGIHRPVHLLPFGYDSFRGERALIIWLNQGAHLHI